MTRKTGPGTLTGQGTWLGTPSYMAPEQWSVDGAGPASDRYALGVIAFELLSGAPPFSASSVPAMMEQHFRAEVPALSTRGAVGVPPSIDAVLERALAKDPEARYPSAKELVAALRNAAGTGVHRARGAVEKPAASTERGAGDRGRRRARRRGRGVPGHARRRQACGRRRSPTSRPCSPVRSASRSFDRRRAPT